MKTLSVITVALATLFFFAHPGKAGNVIGIWSKTTSSDPNNVAIFYQESDEIRAIGYSGIGGKSVWYAKGKAENDKISFSYHYSRDAVPGGWERDGTMELTISEDQTVMRGKAISESGKWSGPIEFKRVQIRMTSSVPTKD